MGGSPAASVAGDSSGAPYGLPYGDARYAPYPPQNAGASGSRSRGRRRQGAPGAGGSGEREESSDDEAAGAESGRLSPQTGTFLGSGAIGMRIGRILDSVSRTQ